MIRVRQIKVDILDDSLVSIKRELIKRLKVDQINKIDIVRKSIDARDKNNIYYVYEVDVDTPFEKSILGNNIRDVIKTPNEEYIIEVTGTEEYKRPVIVGSGPAGLFSAYILAENGYKPLVIERGEKIEDRVNTVENFFKTNKLNTESNIQFGEGGAGTFSDGKLNTGIKDSNNRKKKIFDIFVECGAPSEIKYLNKPHIGTDVLRQVIINLRNKIISMGGEFRYSTKLTNLIVEDNKLTGIEVNNSELIDCSLLVLAIGHSARDTFYMLRDKNINMSSKPFAVGVRVMHPQDMINKSQYGKYYDKLPPSDYKLTYTTKDNRGVYSFCMCPGGYVVNSSSEEGYLCINGMSNYKRDSGVANSAIVVTVSNRDFGEDIFSGIEFQRKLEKNAYLLCDGNIPLQLYGDYVDNKISNNLGSVKSKIMGDYSFGNINKVFPDYINNSIKEAMNNFGKKIKGFDRIDSIVLGVEARTSSPIRIERNEDGESNIFGIYPCGEGCGYAGGITSAAVDGIKVAEYIMKKYKNT